MKKENLKSFSYLFFLFAFVFLGFFISMIVRGRFSDNMFISLLFLVLALIQLRAGLLFRAKSRE